MGTLRHREICISYSVTLLRAKLLRVPGNPPPAGSACPVSPPGNPPPEVIWLHDGNEIQESEDFHFEQRGTQHSLCIQEVFPEDTGTYTCEAWNSVGEVRTQAVLMVQGEAAGLSGVGAGGGGKAVVLP